jgi:hypothetical protein
MSITPWPSSPFSPAFERFAGDLPDVFHQQFLQNAADRAQITIHGSMHQVWIKPWMRPIFGVLGRLGILLPRGGQDVPTELNIRLGHDARGLATQRWNRSLAFDKPAQFNSRMAWIPELSQPVELVGPGQILGMLWSSDFVPPRHLQLDTCGWVLRFGKRYLQIPAFLTPWTLGRVEFAQDADPDDPNRFHIDLQVLHALFGLIFSYRGTFQLHTSDLDEATPALREDVNMMQR